MDEVKLEEILRQYNIKDIHTGLTRDQALLQREKYGMHVVKPPVQCPSWLCCLLPCLLRTKAMDLYHQSLPTECLVIRNKRKLRMDATSLVVGDVVVLQAGKDRATAIVPADARLVECSEDFQVDMSLLCPESITSVKKCSLRATLDGKFESENIVLMGSHLVSGHGKAVITAVGDQTVWGKMLKEKKWPQDHHFSDEVEPLVKAV